MHKFMSQETIDKESIPQHTGYYTREESALEKDIRELAFGKAIKFKCGCSGDMKGLQSDCHQAAARLRKAGVKISLRTQTEEKPLTLARQKQYDNSSDRGLFKRTCYLYIWKEPESEED